MRRPHEHAPITFGDLEAETIMTPSGPAWSLRIGVESAAALPEDAELWLWLRHDGEFIKADSDRWADAEGNVCIQTLCEEDEERPIAFVATVPFVAVPSLCPRRVELHGEVQDENHVLIEEIVWPLCLPSRVQREEGHLLGAFVGAAVETVGELGRVHRRRIESFLAQAWKLDEEGVDVLRQTLARRLNGRWNQRAWETSLVELDENERRLLASFLLHVMAPDGVPTPAQDEEAEALFEFFGMGIDVWRDCREAARGKRKDTTSVVSTEASFVVLGLDATADWVAVRRAYRKLVGDYHPDKVANLPEGFQHFASERTRQLIQAYEHLKKHFER